MEENNVSIFLKKKELEIIISSLKSFESPKIELEQYETPTNIISEIVNDLNLMNLIKEKEILEIACGTAKFSIALSFYFPKLIIAFDIDKDAIRIAKENYEKIKKNYNVSKICFFIGDIRNVKFKNKFDLAIMNPPFGIRGKLKDIEFLEFAFNCSNFVVSINPNGKNIEFFRNFGKKFKFELIKFKKILFPIKRVFHFHRKKKKDIEVLILFFKKSS